ncbi:hypothetical protein [Nocardioides sp.]|uniref:hypothetical protein n=1 Tax=Nocardioides sp. TaxID=35761 RepID=UPI00286D7775|nr:hypothetical protein [Nocardioides sp.]
MELKVFWRSLRKRWYLVLVLMVVSGAATFLVADRAGPDFEASGTVLIFPPFQTQGPSAGVKMKGNPYLGLGGVSQARDVLVRALTSKSVSDQFGEQFPTGTSFEVTPDYTNSAPIILFTTEAGTPDVAVTALKSLMDRVPSELDNLQSGLDLPPAEKVTALVLTQDEQPVTSRKSQIRAALLAAAALGGSGLLMIALIDGLLAGRRRVKMPEATTRRDEPTDGTRNGKGKGVTAHPATRSRATLGARGDTS